MIETLPDSRLRIVKGLVPHKEWGMAQPIFCANCGESGGLIPEQNQSYAFYLCNECWESVGHLTGVMAIPESVVRRDARLRQLEREKC